MPQHPVPVSSTSPFPSGTLSFPIPQLSAVRARRWGRRFHSLSKSIKGYVHSTTACSTSLTPCMRCQGSRATSPLAERCGYRSPDSRDGSRRTRLPCHRSGVSAAAVNGTWKQPAFVEYGSCRKLNNHVSARMGFCFWKRQVLFFLHV